MFGSRYLIFSHSIPPKGRNNDMFVVPFYLNAFKKLFWPVSSMGRLVVNLYIPYTILIVMQLSDGIASENNNG